MISFNKILQEGVDAKQYDQNVFAEYLDVVYDYLVGANDDIKIHTDQKLYNFISHNEEFIEGLWDSFANFYGSRSVSTYRGFNFNHTNQTMMNIYEKDLGATVDIYTKNNFLFHHWTTEKSYAKTMSGVGYRGPYGLAVHKPNMNISRIVYSSEAIWSNIDKNNILIDNHEKFMDYIDENEVIIRSAVQDAKLFYKVDLMLNKREEL